MCAQIHAWVYTHACRGQRKTSALIFKYYLPFLFTQGLSLTLTSPSRLGQWGPGIHLSLSSTLRLWESTIISSIFTWVLGVKLGASHLKRWAIYCLRNLTFPQARIPKSSQWHAHIWPISIVAFQSFVFLYACAVFQTTLLQNRSDLLPIMLNKYEQSYLRFSREKANLSLSHLPEKRNRRLKEAASFDATEKQIP